MVQSLASFLVILNPFALCLYLWSLIDELERATFFRVLLTASAVSLGAFWLCAFGGDWMLRMIFAINPEGLRVFGGVVFAIIAYNYVAKGYRAVEMLRGSLEELPSTIAVPFMIGAGTITQALLIGQIHGHVGSLVVLAGAMAATYGIVFLFYLVDSVLRKRHERIFRRYVNILCRLNGLLIGAFSVDMIISGAHAIWVAG